MAIAAIAPVSAAALVIAAPKPKVIAPVVNAVLSLEPETDLQFIARFPLFEGVLGDVFEGTLLELAASLRTGKLRPIQVPLLKLTRDVLARFHALRGELELSQGDLDATFRTSSLDLASEALPHLAGGKLRVLATTGAQRTPFLPDVPTMLESGYRDVVAEVWVGVFMPPRTPAAIVNHAAAAIAETQKTPDFQEAFGKFAMEPVTGTPESFGRRIRSDLAAWGPIIKASGFTADD